MSLVYDFIKESVRLWLEVSPYLLLGMVISGILHIFLGKDFISRHLGKGNIYSIIKATLLGIPLPVCSCGVIPIAASLRKDGAHKSSVLSFLVSTPTTGIDSFLATYSLLGPLFAIFRPIGALVSGITLGVLDFFFEGKSEKLKEMPRHAHKKISHAFKLREFSRFTFVEIPNDIGKWLLLGTILGGAISAFVPQELFTKYLVFPLDFLVVLIVAVPLYVCATGSIPVAASLIYKGFSPGAALVFLIAGPATNAISMSFVYARLGKKSFYLYLFNIIFVSIFMGLAFNHIWSILGKDILLITGSGKMLSFEVKVIAAIILSLLIIGKYFKRTTQEMKADLEIIVPDIHCSHCQFTIKEGLNSLPGIERVSINLHKKLIRIKGTIDKKQVIDRIKEIGFHPE